MKREGPTVANRRLLDCVTGLIAGAEETRGLSATDAEIQETITSPHGQASYAQASARSYVEAAKKALAERSGTKASIWSEKISQSIGGKPQDWHMFSARMDEILGPEVMEPMIKKLEDFTSQFPEGTFDDYKREVVPFLKQYKDITLETLDPIYKKQFSQAVDDQIKGFSLFRQEFNNKVPRSVVDKAVDNSLKAVVSNSPNIALYNPFEVLPKSYVLAIEKVGPGRAEAALMKTIADFSSATKGKFWMKAEGVPPSVYDSVSNSSVAKWLEKRIGIGNLVDATENPLRTFSYLLGENLEPGFGRKAVEEVAFTYRPGNEPAMVRNTVFARSVQLMRFSIRAGQMYLGLWRKAVGGGLQTQESQRAAMALVGFHSFMAVQTGLKSSVPAPLWLALPEDVREQIEQLDQDTPGLNLVKHLGIDISQATQPLGGIAVSVGGAIATTAAQSGITRIAKAPAAAAEDPLLGAMNLLEGAVTLSLPTKAPTNFAASRMIRAIRKSIENNDLSTQGVVDETREAFSVAPKE